MTVTAIVGALSRLRERVTVRVPLLVALAFIASFAHAALFDDNEARRRIDETSARLTQIQRQLEDRIAALETQLKSGGLVDLFNCFNPGGSVKSVARSSRLKSSAHSPM